MRLDRFLSELNISSRKELKAVIRAGRVCVNGNAVFAPESSVDPETDEVALDGRPLSYARFRYFAVDKPTGVLTACSDKKQTTVIDILPDDIRRRDLFPVGRLDKDTSGLLIITNDGEYAHKVISPKYGIEKLYFAETESPVTDEDVEAFRTGIHLRDGLDCLPAELIPLEDCSCIVKVREGKYHQVRRMLAAVGKPVIMLRRLSIGGLALENLDFNAFAGQSAGGFCELSQEEAMLVFEK